eukprot:11202865-Lingulodinium_polyedra.AAC.1
MPPANRALRAVPANTDELAEWQRMVSATVAELHQTAFETRSSPNPLHPKAFLNPDEAEAKTW